jgi:hypothetical protein
MFACWCARQTGILNEGKVWRGIVGAAEELARNGVGWLRMKEALVEGLREFGKEIERLQDRKQGSDRELLGMAAVLWTGCSSEWAAAWYAAWESAGAIAASGDGTRDSVEQLQAARLREMIGKLGGSGARGRRGLLANELRRVKSAFGP